MSNKQPAPAPRLARREIECLTWVLQGKTSWETGRILGVSETTVAFYLRNARSKLQCRSKHQAALKAIALGLLEWRMPDPG